MLPMILAGLGLGAAKAVGNAQGASNDRKRRASETMYSPWTGLKPSTEIRGTNAIGDIAGGALSGAAFAQNLEASQIANDNLRASMAPSVAPAAIDAKVATLPAQTSAWEQGVRKNSMLMGPPRARQYSLGVQSPWGA